MNKSVISYITRDGKEGNLNVNLFNMKKINNLLSKWGFNCYEVENNLSFVHFKNVIFEQSSYFYAKDVVVIFENCIFKESSLTVDGGSVEIINPVIFRNNNGLRGLKEINIANADDVRVVVNDNKPISYKISAQNIEIDGGKSYFGSIDGHSIAGKNVFLNNLEVFNTFWLEKVENLSLCNSVFKGGSGLWLNIINNLYLNNVQLSSMNIDINCPNIRINDVTLAARDYIKINDDVYSSKNGNPIVLNDSDLLGDSKVYSRKVLISILKGYRDLVEQCILNKSKEDEVLSCYNGLINTCKNDIKKLENKLETLECNKQKYSENLEKKLFRSKAIDYVKK